jgi:4'-phosphopantetheinyl transferase
MTNWCRKDEWTLDAWNPCCKSEAVVSFASLCPANGGPPDVAWHEGPRRPPLPDRGVHVWRARLDELAEQAAAFRPCLSPDEQERADRFRFERERTRFVAGRSMLRTILGAYLSVPAEHVVFSYGPHGKPGLRAGSGQVPVHFNATHSDGLALFAVIRAGDIGIDLERIRTVTEADQIAQHFFSKQENAWWRSLAPELRREAFFNLWTRKEARLKATGEGISEKLDQMDVPPPGDGAACLPASLGKENGNFGWWHFGFVPERGYAAALACNATTTIHGERSTH